jgi:hypothetical protein
MEPYTLIRNSPTKYAEFLQSGGWNGIKYVRVPVIQGELRTVLLGSTRAQRFETFVINSVSVEAAKNSISSPFFEVILRLKNGHEERWVEIENIRLAGPYDKVFEKSILDDGTGVKLKFGDGITGLMLPEGCYLSCQYIDTLGSGGNVDFKYQITKMSFPGDIQMIDPRDNAVKSFLSCTNISPINGGQDMQDEDDYRKKAPLSYLQSYAIATVPAYEQQIMKNSPIGLLNIKCFPYVNTEITQPVSLDAEEQTVGNILAIQSKHLGITALAANGDIIEDPEESFIKPLAKVLNDKKGPNDFFYYIPPNKIQLAVSSQIKSKDINIEENAIKTDMLVKIFNKYSIYAMEFMQPFYTSDIIHMATSLKYTEYTHTLIESLASYSFDQNDIELFFAESPKNNMPVDENTYVLIPFSFDSIYNTSSSAFGFRNYSNGAKYLLKVDVLFLQDSTKNRTLFLFDSRDPTGTLVETLQNSKTAMIDTKGIQPTISSIINHETLGRYTFIDETQNGYDNRQVRAAQYPLISNITSDDFMEKARGYKTMPFEHRPYYVDNNGENRIFNTKDVPRAEQRPISKDATIGELCYRVNSNYINNVDIIFNEGKGLDTPAAGYVILPLEYLGFLDILKFVDNTILVETLQSLLENTLELKIYAQPLLKEITPVNETDIISVELDDIKVEKITA